MKKYLHLLKSIALFENIEESDLLTLLLCLSARVSHYYKNQAVFVNGEKITSIGIVLSGQVQIVKEDYYGNRCIVANLDKGHLFGETFVFANTKTLPVSVYSTAESDILFINYHKIITPCSKACHFHNKLIYNMLHILAMKNITLNQKIEFMSKPTTREKLLAYLSYEAQKANSNSFHIPFNRQELADYLSVNRSAMSAELCKLRDDKILNFNRNWFELL
ncbi:MAG: Crp/Fnr family transcriptional regulator [Epulopiscium sp.]|nr:Crp/Fnr family transcriptional regulator [Candidatus Epulonipiscium sp.]